MAYVVPTTFTAGSVLTAAQLNVIGADIVDHETRINAGGLFFINKTTWTAAATKSIDSVFSSTYENYRVIFNGYSSSTTTPLAWRFRTSGVDYSGANYSFAGPGLSSSNAASNDYASGNTYMDVGGLQATGLGNGSTIIDIYGPNVGSYTTWTSQSTFAGAGVVYSRHSGGLVSVNQAFDGFTIYGAGGGNIAGTIRVYGYHN